MLINVAIISIIFLPALRNFFSLECGIHQIWQRIKWEIIATRVTQRWIYRNIWESISLNSLRWWNTEMS